MAPLLPSNTPRFRFVYTTVGHQHTFEMRSLISPAAMGTLVHQLLTALSNNLYDLVLDLVNWAPAGSNIFNPVITGIEGNHYGLGVAAADVVPFFVNFIGRSSGGRRNRIMLFGAKSLGIDYRFVAGEDPDIDAAVAILQGAAINTLAIDGLPTVWKSYVNAGVNAHWIKAVRP